MRCTGAGILLMGGLATACTNFDGFIVLTTAPTDARSAERDAGFQDASDARRDSISDDGGGAHDGPSGDATLDVRGPGETGPKDSGGATLDGGDGSAGCATGDTCSASSPCTTASTTCAVVSCALGCCATMNASPETSCGPGPSGPVCDGNGHCVECVKATNCPASLTTCEQVICTDSACSQKAAPQNTSCDDNNGKVCTDAGTCVQCTSTDESACTMLETCNGSGQCTGL